ncbi:hypothetical protein QR721_11240 [Aciduricibacillus chroicocephali]|uniref:Diaminopimelate epimerase n=1 Tax=Aciduricibacillus chroicocephali TaxID=3054939 RepID=A0ABY9KTH0_9BACI|nr:hypothetical protein QR721_11240 [Bacillaceae bacterium 44XB]
MKLDYVKISPSQNMTALITSKANPADYAKIASMMMDYEYVNAEQAGFLIDPKDKNAILRLEMSGGEFCGNAVLSAAAYGKYKGWCTDNSFLMEASGAASPLACEVKILSPVLFESKAEMPKPLSIEEISITYTGETISGSVVRMEGITHFVTDCWLEEEEFPALLEAIKEVIQDKAIGIIPFKHIDGTDYEIRPYVHVTDTGSTFFERACGSGTLALGAYLSSQLEESTFSVQQPGGTIHVESGSSYSISTTVRITSEGTVYLPLDE